MKELASQFMALISSIAPAVIPLIAVYIGWKLSSQSERRKRALENLEKRFEAFRQLKQVIDNIPRELSAKELEARMNSEPEFLKSIEHRLIRLFGLRRELIPYLDESMVSFIDRRFSPLFRAETGSCDLKPDALESFSRCCEDLVKETDSIEKRLGELYRKKIE